MHSAPEGFGTFVGALHEESLSAGRHADATTDPTSKKSLKHVQHFIIMLDLYSDSVRRATMVLVIACTEYGSADKLRFETSSPLFGLEYACIHTYVQASIHTIHIYMIYIYGYLVIHMYVCTYIYGFLHYVYIYIHTYAFNNIGATYDMYAY